jgi:hypothetical protein
MTILLFHLRYVSTLQTNSDELSPAIPKWKPPYYESYREWLCI